MQAPTEPPSELAMRPGSRTCDGRRVPSLFGAHETTGAMMAMVFADEAEKSAYTARMARTRRRRRAIACALGLMAFAVAAYMAA